MIHGGKRASALLFLGDLAVFAASLWITLFIRYQEVPTQELLSSHIPPFLLLFAVWLLVFYMSGLYGKRIILSKTSLPNALLATQLANILIAALFFFAVPGVGIAPKTTLAIYLGVSLMLIFPWRLMVFPRISVPAMRVRAILIAAGPEAEELVHEVNANARYHLEFIYSVDPEALNKGLDALFVSIQKEGISVIVADTEHEYVKQHLPAFYDFCFGEHRRDLVDFYSVYEDVFDRVPLSLLSHDWFLRNVTDVPAYYAALKRGIDVVGGVLMGLITLVALPCVAVALRLEGKGPVFIAQDRIGIHGSRMKVYKFRSMRFNDASSKEWVGEGENRVTKVGNFLRLTSLDEFPQFLNILKGEMSLIGPRNDIEGLGHRLAESIPYYLIRYSTIPGITGWAQINQQYEQGHISPQSIEETKMRLAYDFYYLKHRSLGLDTVIALKTIKRMVFRISAW